MHIIFLLLGGALVGLGASRWWFGKSKVRKPKVKGLKRLFYTHGELLIRDYKELFKEVISKWKWH